MEIIPDTKDWTWVLDRPCPECGFDTGGIKRDSIPDLLRDNAADWVELLGQGEAVHQRPSPVVWSTLEYACHVRDVFRLYDARLGRMLTEDDPLYPNWDQDATAVEERYREQDPATVSGELNAAATLLADHFAGVKGAEWQRTGRRSDGARFTVETFARYLVHDPLHHLHDVTGRRYGPDTVESDSSAPLMPLVGLPTSPSSAARTHVQEEAQSKVAERKDAQGVEKKRHR